MSQLSPQARELLGSARRANPGPGVRERGRARLGSRLAATALLPTASAAAFLAKATPVSATTLGSLGAAVGLSLLVGFGVGLGGTAALARLTSPESSGAAHVSSDVSRVRQASTAAPPTARSEPDAIIEPVEAERLDHQLAKPAPAAAPATRLAASTSAPSIARETELLMQTQRALGSRRWVAALQTLDRYDSEFPHGALREEALGAKVVALCALGNVGAGRAEAARFARLYPTSPLIGRVQAACGATATDPR